MDMTNRVPAWLTPIAWLFIAAALLSAAAIAVDIYVRRHRRGTIADELVWISSGLYLGPLALPLHLRHRRSPDTATPAAVAGLPGGGASAVAHLVGVPLVVASGLTIAGIDLWVMIIVIGLVAATLLFVYERTSARSGAAGPVPMGTAVAAAVLTVLAFDIGMGGWMLLLHFNEYMPPAADASFWFLMQIGVVLGLLTGYPAVAWLGRRRELVAPS